MKLTSIKLACTALLGAATLAWGQNDEVPPDETANVRTFGDGVLSENLAIYDANGNGTIDLEELQVIRAVRNRQGRHDQLRRRWDTNHDGRIDEAERAAAAVRIRQLIEERRTRRFNEVDQNSDGFLTQEEFLQIAAVAATDANSPGMGTELFKHLDYDQDRRISKAEFLRSLNTTRADAIGPAAVPASRPNTIPLPISPAR